MTKIKTTKGAIPVRYVETEVPAEVAEAEAAVAEVCDAETETETKTETPKPKATNGKKASKKGK
ncbi:hypothetical protein PP178_04285 [Zeaxanthinibacter sp. PT1]|uniref:hypothetical protein n=1 Tax=Zeaxanthinibacter TaxID=561554 RepID=UPI00234ABC4A|nr:hypothetical protein [Zeaxanthinibacter sp. PT1]MDC6350758.1 hypothetical protein [Zeaxanthinibacter sp. PT1]